MKRLIIILMVVLVLAAASLGGWAYYDLRKPITHTKTGQYIEIPKGSSPSAITRRLAAE
jgi:cell division protein YceG involved in septum cleavage